MKDLRVYFESLNSKEDQIQFLRSLAQECNCWDGSLENLDVNYNDDEFFNIYFEGKPMEAVRSAHYGNYNYTDEYVRFNGYGNLESLSEWDYEAELMDNSNVILETAQELYEDNHIDIDYLMEDYEEMTGSEEESNEEEETEEDNE
jgi:hypothetical protein